MKILIDTQIFLWATLDRRLPGHIRSLIDDPDSEIYLSTASAWEISIKYSKGKLPLPEHPRTFISKTVAATDIKLLPITFRHSVNVTELPHYHKDPFDRLLVVQANESKMSLISVDENIKKYDVDIIDFTPE
ncbi:MAG TPA: type II toxin-antitoxin system VapC family toxin [Pyrinomonadaceae bacterium]|nr:type II toxin-antitoxin system VapC family toxin [Pyrinomonadaceae bacterium]